MATNKKISEAGWFYHAPYKAKPDQEQVGAPPASQIPGLSNLSGVPEEPQKKLWIKESDSDYIVLAKQGGRPDLLRYRDPKPRSEGPQGYPRCEWYYHNTGENDSNQQNTGDHEFLLPDYMVHQDWTGGQHSPEASPQKGAPYAFDKDTAYAREGGNPTDKTVRLPEIKPSGYGVRAQKQQGKTTKHAPIQRPQPIKPTSELDEGKLKYEPVRGTSEEQRPVMGKLLSHGYVSDWEHDRDTWNSRQRKNQDAYDAKCGRPKEKMQTEYQQHMIKRNPSGASNTSRQQSGNGPPRKQRELTEHEQELFKLSKFKNVAAKTESRRHQDHSPIKHSQESAVNYQHVPVAM